MVGDLKNPEFNGNNSTLYGACFFFATMALSVKLCTQPSALLGDHHMGSLQVVFFRSFLCLLLIAPLLVRAYEPRVHWLASQSEARSGRSSGCGSAAMLTAVHMPVDCAWAWAARYMA